MSDTDLWSAWAFWMLFAGGVIAVAAALLVLIWLTARSIQAHARRALRAAEAIRENTQPIWDLQTSTEAAEDLLQTVRSIEEKARLLAGALEGRDHAPAKR